MSPLSLYSSMLTLGRGIELCSDQHLTAPSLILIYSAIDTAGWLASSEKYATRNTFISWVDRYLLTARPLNCDAIDLYAARCGLLHTFTAESKLTEDGKARQICYAWGSARVEDLQETINRMGAASTYVAVHADHLYEAWRLGMLQFVEEIEADEARKLGVSTKAAKFTAQLGLEPIRDFLIATDAPPES